MKKKLKAAFETEIYISDGGYFVLKQDDPLSDESIHVCLTPEQMRVVIREMQEALEDTCWHRVVAVEE